MKTKMILFTVIALCLMMGGTGCENESMTDIYHTWKFQGFGSKSNSSLEKADPPASVSERCYLLTFEKDGKFTGYTTTNGISGEYVLNSKKIKLENMFGTEIAERGNGYKYSDALLLIESYEIVKNNLKLYYNQGQHYLLFNLSN